MKKAAFWIKKLELTPHPEGGFYREVYRSSEKAGGKALPKRFGGPRSFCTSIYYLLRGEEISLLHKIKSDEIWHFYQGTFAVIFVISPDGKLRNIKLGPDFADGQVFQAVIPAGHWLGAAVGEPGSYSLIGCTVSPGFDFRDFQLGRRDELLALYPRHRPIIERLTKPR